MKPVVKKICEMLILKGYTQDGFERAAGLPKGRFSKWKGGTGEPTVSEAIRMAGLLGVGLLELVSDGGTSPPRLDSSDDQLILSPNQGRDTIKPGSPLPVPAPPLDRTAKTVRSRTRINQPAAVDCGAEVHSSIEPIQTSVSITEPPSSATNRAIAVNTGVEICASPMVLDICFT
jgi:transcriptional regulator with XRE-family HTH domain